MNKTYRNIWNTATGTWTAVAETARSRSKGSARAARQAVAVLALGSASIGGAFAADACTTEDGKGGSLDAAGVCKVTAPRTIGTDAIGTTATLTDNYIKVNSTSADLAAATGSNAVAMGQAVTSSGSSSVAIGSGTSADGLHSMALGASSSVVGDRNLAVGDGATVSTLRAAPTNAIAIGTGANVSDAGVAGATGSIAIGNNAAAAGTGTITIGTSARHSGSGATVVGSNASAMGGGAGVAVGTGSAAAGSASVAMGPLATSTGLGSIAIGSQAVTTNNNSVAIGNTAAGSAINTTAIGSNAKATGDNATTLGQSTSASGMGAISLGFRANAQADNSIAIGMDSVANRNNTVSVGSATLQRQVVNVAAGTQATDAVNVSQLQPVVTALGGGATINSTTGAVTGPTYTLANGGTQTTVGDALGALDGNITTINNKLATVVTDDYVKVDTTSGATAAQAGVSALAVGANAQGTGSRATAVGNNSVASDANSAAFGMGTTASGNASTAIGAYASATGYHSSALGVASIASGSESVAIGTNSRADRDNSVSVGSSTLQRQITNMAAGTQGTDAVNVSQLSPVVTALGGGAAIDPTTGAVTGPTYTLTNGGTQTTVGGALGALDGALNTANGNIARNTGDIADLASQIGSGTVGLVQQAGAGANITVGANTDGAAVDFTGTAGARKLTGVDAGAVTATSKDAVNGSQLHGVSSSVASAIGAGSTVNADGSISAPSFSLGDGSGGTTTVHSVGDAVTNLDGRVTVNEGAVASLADQIGNGKVGLVQQAGPGANITVGANTDGAAVSFVGTAGARKLSGVANGVNDDDAVTIAQLKATGLIDYTGKEIAAVTYDDISLGSVTFGGTGGTKLLNVAPGLIAAGSMEAVNGGQLHDLQERFAQEYARLDGRVGNLESGGGSGGGGGGGGSDGNVGRGTGGDGSLVVGNGSVASGENSTAVGQGAVASGDNGSAFGQGSAASGSNSSAIGQGSVASGSDSTAIGQGSKATGNGSVAIGAGSVADRDNSVSVGSAGHERQITNVADGTAPTDAVNVRQLDQRIGETNRMINDVAKNAYAGVAAAMAMPNLTPSQPGKTVVAAGAANYKSGSAIAAGATYRTRDGKWLMNGAVSVTSTGDAGVRAQVGYEF
ncbi:YadA family autotransporter adhesin [Burkholderia anthina]|uniref:YadA family autotransporter adhesin n=1 Tax=Burkholderia anthina TaxID=179879 RepID=UPI0007574326|nr:ESPR-type extended signal peptide-containing protein [Burkholderia anthina]KVE08136.1 hypothetical protein WS65_09950 [Burkholderia anthina]